VTEPARSPRAPLPGPPGTSPPGSTALRHESREVRIYLFESGTHVLWAEEVAAERGVPVEAVPAPPGFSDHCGLAIRAFASAGQALERLLREEGISFRVLT
jgi:hypothetical protein